MADMLRFTNVSKRFSKGRVALDDLSFNVPEYAIAAFVGANGAGKTTTFSLVGRFFLPDAGTIEVAGKSLKDFRASGGVVGILPQDVLYFENRTVLRHILLFAQLAGFRGNKAQSEAERVLELVQLADRSSEIVANLSHGMKVRLGVAQALVGSPPLVLLDEPTAGLDPRLLSHFRSLVDSLRGSTTLVISSHDLTQLQLMCDYVCIINHGKLVRQAPLSEMLGQISHIKYRLEAGQLNFSTLVEQMPEFHFVQSDQNTLVAEFERTAFQVTEVNSRVLFWLFKNKVGVLGVESQRSLEQTFLEETTK